MARYYKHNGKKLPSVTTIISLLDKSGPLTYWAANCACDYILDNIKTGMAIDAIVGIVDQARKEFKSVSAKALDIGSEVHAVIEEYLKSGIEPTNPKPEVLSGFVAFLEWKDTWGTWETIETEQTLYADMFAGTTDLIAKLNGDVWLLDFKTSKKPRGNKPYAEWGYQTAAYRSCIKANKNGVLRLDKETGYPDFYDLSETYEKDLKIFGILTDLYYATHSF